jgi:hypothetical protein
MQPRELWSDESEGLSNDDNRLPFFEAVHVRQKSIAAFHQGLLRFRLERALGTRPRSDMTQSYHVGQLVDIYLKAPKKDLEGWRGPGTILGFIEEGRVTVRWQSVVRDLPIHLIRPHINVLNSSALKQIADHSVPKESAIAIARPAGEGTSSGSKDVAVPGASDVFFSQDQLLFVISLCEARNNFEVFFNVDSADQLRGPYLDTLISLASALQSGSQQLHAIDPRHKCVWSRDAERDQHVIFGVGGRIASDHGVKAYSGVILQAGRRFVPSLPDIAQFHCISWLDSNFLRLTFYPGNVQIDWIREGVCDLSDLHLLRTIVVLETRLEVPPLQELLERSEEIAEPPQEGRVRNEEWPDTALKMLADEKDYSPSISDPGP